MKNLLFILLMSVSMSAYADYYMPEPIPGPQGEPGIDGVDGVDGVDGIDGVTTYTEQNYNNEKNQQAIASLGAMSGIPALNNHGGDSGVGVGIGSYGDQQALAIGFIQQMNKNLNFKVAASRGIGSHTSGSNLVLGAGGTLSW